MTDEHDDRVAYGKALEALAQRLHEARERFEHRRDPAYRPTAWDRLDNDKRNAVRASLDDIVRHRLDQVDELLELAGRLRTDYSDNGWSVVGSDQVDNTVAVAGVTFPGGFRAGNVATVFRHLFTQLHERVEPIVAGWCWGFENRDNVNNPGSASCHSSATAGDYNAPNHPNGARGTWSSSQVAEIRQIMAECPAFLWGGDFGGTADEMHWQIANNTSDADLGRIIAALPDNAKDWFDMATEEDLRKVVDEAIDDKLDDIVKGVWSYKESYTQPDGAGSRTLSIHDMIGEIRGKVE